MATRKKPWKTLGSKIAYKNPWIQIREDRVIRPDGKRGIYGVVETNGAVVFIVALNQKGHACFVTQFRYTNKKWSLELPAGNSDGDPALRAAKRELWEETGFKAKRWKSIGGAYPANGLIKEWSHVFIAEDLHQTGKDKKHEDGVSAVTFYSFKDVVQMIKQGVITDGQSITAVFLVLLHLGKLRVT